MKLTVSEAARLSGVSVRTLHYYDQIGLLRPDEVDGHNGYRYYGPQAMALLQEILFYRELDFSLKEIAALLHQPGRDRTRALQKQRALLELKKQRLEGLIALTDKYLKGETGMDFEAFSTTDYERARAQYAQEVRERWGGTPQYGQSEARAAARDGRDWAALGQEAEEIFRQFAACRTQAPDGPDAQALTARWQAHITAHFYPCSKEILTQLGQMYVADPRFRQNIDRFGPGTSDFMSRAIAAYCKE